MSATRKKPRDYKPDQNFKKITNNEQEDSRREGLTNDDNAGDKPTNDDNASGSPTLSDKSRQLERTTVRLAAWQKSQLQRIADADGRLLSDVVREAVRQYLRGR